METEGGTKESETSFGIRKGETITPLSVDSEQIAELLEANTPIMSELGTVEEDPERGC